MARPRSFDEDRVLDSAVDTFRTCGYDGVSLPQLIDRLGICRQSLYNVFGDKRGLYLRALERWGEREVDAKLALLDAPGSALENVRTVLRAWAGLASSCPAEGCLTASGIVQNHDDPDALAVLQRQVDRFEQGLVDALRRARRARELRAGVPIERLARTIVTMGNGIGVLCRLPNSALRVRDAVSTMLALIDDAAA